MRLALEHVGVSRGRTLPRGLSAVCLVGHAVHLDLERAVHSRSGLPGRPACGDDARRRGGQRWYAHAGEGRGNDHAQRNDSACRLEAQVSDPREGAPSGVPGPYVAPAPDAITSLQLHAGRRSPGWGSACRADTRIVLRGQPLPDFSSHASSLGRRVPGEDTLLMRAARGLAGVCTMSAPIAGEMRCLFDRAQRAGPAKGVACEAKSISF